MYPLKPIIYIKDVSFLCVSSITRSPLPHPYLVVRMAMWHLPKAHPLLLLPRLLPQARAIRRALERIVQAEKGIC